jgi:hypothetical protein
LPVLVVSLSGAESTAMKALRIRKVSAYNSILTPRTKPAPSRAKCFRSNSSIKNKSNLLSLVSISHHSSPLKTSTNPNRHISRARNRRNTAQNEEHNVLPGHHDASKAWTGCIATWNYSCAGKQNQHQPADQEDKMMRCYNLSFTAVSSPSPGPHVTPYIRRDTCEESEVSFPHPERGNKGALKRNTQECSISLSSVEDMLRSSKQTLVESQI